MASGPAPPPHGAHHKTFEMPTGNVDVFVIPSHSAGSGFLYLPSLQPQWNSFCAGVACTLLGVQFYHLMIPVLRHWVASIAASGGMAVVLVVVCVGVLGWAWGKTQSETGKAEARGDDNNDGGESRTGSAEYRSGSQNQAPPPSPRNGGPHDASSRPNPSAGAAPHAGSKSNWQPPKSTPATSDWERAREETRKKEEERRKKELAETKAREAAEKDKWEKARAREKESRERETREKVAKERRDKEVRERTEREAKDRFEKAKAEGSGVGSKTYHKPTAQSFVDDDETYSFRPYDTPKRSAGTNSHSSAQSESSYAPSHSTARTTPPQAHRGPYSTKDEEKIVIDAVFAFNDKFQKPTAELVSGTGSVTDGLVLKLTSEGLFIDDDLRDEPQREWDVKAWTLKQIESGEYNGKHVVRASKRDADNTKYIFVINQSEGWKIAKGLLRLRRSPQIRSLGQSGLSASATMAILNSVGYA